MMLPVLFLDGIVHVVLTLSVLTFCNLKQNSVTLKSEFDSVSPWYSHREMEENMVCCVWPCLSLFVKNSQNLIIL